MSIQGKQLAITQALMVWLASRPNVQALNLVTCDLDWSLKPQPRYPADPVADLPDALLQNHFGDNQRTAGDGVSAIYLASIWLRLRQTPGDNAQVDLMTANKVLEDELLSHANPYNVQICGADQQTPTKVNYPDELSHPLVDEPRLRVAFAEIQIQITYTEE